jgi:hypothetical protein
VPAANLERQWQRNSPGADLFFDFRPARKKSQAGYKDENKAAYGK